MLLPGRSYYIWAGYSNVFNYPQALTDAALYFSQILVWDKEHAVLTRRDYMGVHESCYYGWKPGEAHEWFGPPNVQDIWRLCRHRHNSHYADFRIMPRLRRWAASQAASRLLKSA